MHPQARPLMLKHLSSYYIIQPVTLHDFRNPIATRNGMKETIRICIAIICKENLLRAAIKPYS